MREIKENYRRIRDASDAFDIRYWQSQEDQALFEAVLEMLNDYYLIRGADASEFRIDKTVESYRRV